MRVLIVEDQFDDVQVVSKILQHNGVEIQVAGNGNQCLAVLEEARPDAVVMDLALPEKDGWETLVEMRSNPDYAHIPVVAVTAYHSPGMEQDTIKAGFDGYFPKPVDANSFVNELAAIIAAN